MLAIKYSYSTNGSQTLGDDKKVTVLELVQLPLDQNREILIHKLEHLVKGKVMFFSSTCAHITVGLQCMSFHALRFAVPKTVLINKLVV